MFRQKVSSEKCFTRARAEGGHIQKPEKRNQKRETLQRDSSKVLFKTVQETELLLTKTPEEENLTRHKIAGWLLSLLTGMDADGILVSYLFQSWGVHVEAKMKEIMTPFRDTYGAILDQAMTEKFGYSTNQIPFNIIYNISKEYGSNMNKS